jgi:4-hydroxy-3-methylbut-2-enyl diphosphate reductase IspH
LTSFIGTSASTPEELINLITNKINDFEIYEKEFIER